MAQDLQAAPSVGTTSFGDLFSGTAAGASEPR
jgi:hypothetical protein